MLSKGRVSVDVLLIADELNAQRAELFQSEQKMLGRASEAIKPPHEHAIEPALPSVVYQPVQSRTTFYGS